MWSDSGIDVAVVGGGLAGLTAATYLARAGCHVTLFEGAGHPGGRAISQERDGYTFNLGAHALYRKGAGVEVLRELGVSFKGGVPPRGSYGVVKGRLKALPDSPAALIGSALLGIGAKVEFARFYTALPRMRSAAYDHLSVRDWLAREFTHPQVRDLLTALIRLTSYTNAPALQSAGAAVAQLRVLLALIYYIDDGWQTLVNGLRGVAVAVGVRIVTGARVAAVERDHAVRAVRLASGDRHMTGAAVLAVAPDEAAALVERSGETPLPSWAARAVPARTACLDVALSRLPVPRHRFALGIDQPMYLSVVSATARLAPEGGAVIQTMKYLDPEQPTDPAADERELEGMLDLAQPGWRDVLVHRRFLPKLVSLNAIDTAATGGIAGRPGSAVPGVPNLFLAGDWVGGEGMLADAAFASGRAAARAVLGATNIGRDEPGTRSGTTAARV